jgi:hypothetical protein
MTPQPEAFITIASTGAAPSSPSTKGHQGQHEHPARVRAPRPRLRARRVRALGSWRHLGLQRLAEERTHDLAELHRGREQRRGQARAQQPAQRALARRPLDFRVDDAPADLDQAPVLDARWARGLAVAAGQAAIEVVLRGARRRRALEHLLHQVDAAARAVELVAEELVGRARGRAEAAVHALAQDRVGGLAVRGAGEFGRQAGLHGGRSECQASR